MSDTRPAQQMATAAYEAPVGQPSVAVPAEVGERLRAADIASRATIASLALRNQLRSGEPFSSEQLAAIIGAIKEVIHIVPIMEQLHPELPEFLAEQDQLLWFLQQRLGRLSVLTAEVASLEAEIQQEIAFARDKGVTWAQIADISGVTPQAVYQRWSEQGREKHRGYQRKRRAQE